MIPTNIFTHYSIQEAFCHIPALVKKAKELGFTHLPITDKHSLSGCPEFSKKCTKKGIVPILGCSFRMENKKYVTLLAKNKNGWHNLIKILGRTEVRNSIECIVEEDIRDYSADLICIDSAFICPDLKDVMGDNYYDIYDIPVYYINKDDQYYHNLLLCSKYKITLSEIDSIEEYRDIIQNNIYYLKSPEEYTFSDLHKFELYDVAEKPVLPKSQETDNPDEYLADLCRKGWYTRGLNVTCKNNKMMQVYGDRIKKELGVFKEAGLANYMLIIYDVARYCRNKKIEVGLRGSAAGCLVSYLIEISDVDPILPDPTLEYHPDRALIFERFYSASRNTADNKSLPDCDLDIPISYRDEIIQYVEDKYGSDCVSNLITFNRLDGRGAIKEVFRILEPVANSYDIANEITKYMVDTAKVQDVLQDIIEENPNYTIINYCIDYIPEIASFYQEFPDEFNTAIHLSKTISHTGKHAAGIVISDKPLNTIIPTKIDDKTGKRIVALEMQEAEYCGVVKYDFLGVAALEKISEIYHMLNDNLLEPTVGQINTKDFEMAD